MQSMTGYGKSTFENDSLKIEVEIKSLNSKNTDIRIKNGFLSAENELKIRKLLSQTLVRGKIDCQINFEYKTNKAKHRINPQIFDIFYKQSENILQKYSKNIAETDFFRTIMQLPDVVEPEEIIDDKIWDYIYKCVSKSAENLTQFRIQEGKATAEVLKNYLQNISDNLSKVADYEQDRIKIIKERITNALKENELKIDKDRFEAELIYYLEKYDINEEKTRLSNHIKYFNETMCNNATGKKLGFIAQEMGREINTLGSKANHFEIQRLVVAMQDNLEKIKEQILNIL